MKRKLCLHMVTLFTILILTGQAFSGEKSVIVGFHQKPGPSEQALIHGAKGIIKRTFHLIPAMAVKISEKEIEKIKKNKKVAYVEEDATYQAVEPFIGDEYINSWGVLHIGADVAHASGNKGTGIRVAVLDTGIDYTHEDLDGNYRGGYDFVFDDDDPFDDSTRSHGTHVAGIIAAEDNDPDKGVIGVAPEADLYAVKVLDGAGFGSVSWIIAGIEWSVFNGMDIVNMSLEGAHADSLQEACEAAYNAGVLLVAAAGNYIGGSHGPVKYPAAYGSVIAVSATMPDDSLWFGSASGAEVELAAPGVDVLSTVTGGNYDFLSGTSQAAPHVAGVAALFYAAGILDENGNGMTNDEVREMLRTTAIDLGAEGRDDMFGFGIVDAVAAALNNTGTDEFTLTRSSGSPRGDAVSRTLERGLHMISIENTDLKKVNVDVFRDNEHLKDLSSTYHFTDKKDQQVEFSINAYGTAFDVIFTPSGKAGTSAEVAITQPGEGLQ